MTSFINSKYSASVSSLDPQFSQSLCRLAYELGIIDFYYSIERLPEVEDGGYLLSPFTSPDPLDANGSLLYKHDNPHVTISSDTIAYFTKIRDSLSNKKEDKELFDIIDTIVRLSNSYNDLYKQEVFEALSAVLKKEKETSDISGAVLIRAKPLNDIYQGIVSCVESLVDL